MHIFYNLIVRHYKDPGSSLILFSGSCGYNLTAVRAMQGLLEGPMRIGFDAREVRYRKGIGTYSRNLLKQFADLG
jgi:hypothetical protein